MQTNPLFIGDIGTKLQFDIGIDSSLVTKAHVNAKNPAGATKAWVATPIPQTTMIEYVLQSGDIDVAGSWMLQLHITTAGWSGYATPSSLQVRQPM